MLVNFFSIFTFMVFSCSFEILTSQVFLAFIMEYLVHLIWHNFFTILTVVSYFVYIGSTDLFLFVICYFYFLEIIKTEEPQWRKMSYFFLQILVLQVLWITMVDSSKKKKFFLHYAEVPIEYFLKLDKLNTTNSCCDFKNLVFN